MLMHAYKTPTHLASRTYRRRTVISLTPLIDVVFILLIFFMLASNFAQRRAIELDAPAGAVTGGGMEGAILVDVRSGGLRVSGEEVTMDALVADIASRMAVVPDARVLVRPASGVVLQETVAVLDRLAAAGIGPLALTRAGE